MPLHPIKELSLPVSLVIDYTLILEPVVDLVLCYVVLLFTRGGKLKGKGK